MPEVINVILHGVFGYIFRDNFIEAYTPAVDGHIYKAGGLDYNKATPLKLRTDYRLRGVSEAPKRCPMPDPTCNPVMPLPSSDKVDYFEKRFCMFRLPYPSKIKTYSQQFYPLDAYELGAVYAGKHSPALNAMQTCPSLLAIVYGPGDGALRLDPIHGGHGIDFSSLIPVPGTCIVNLHIWCTISPQDMKGMTPEGHIRRAFAALVDLIPNLETTLQIPDGFAPTACSETRPPGVEPCDVDPGRQGCIDVRFGKVNCHYSNLMFWPPE